MVAYQYGCVTSAACHGVNVVLNVEYLIEIVRAATVQNAICVTTDRLIIYIPKNDTGCIVLSV